MQDQQGLNQRGPMSTQIRRLYFGPFVMASILLLLVGPGMGQSTTLITLDQAVDLALAQSPSIKAQRTLILQNEAQEITANLRPNPTLSADSQFIPFFSPQDFSGTNLDEVQQFDLGVRRLDENHRHAMLGLRQRR